MQVHRQLQQLIPAMPIRAVEGHASATTLQHAAAIDNIRPPATQD